MNSIFRVLKIQISFKPYLVSLLLLCSVFSNTVYAGCRVQDGTFYSDSKSSMTAFAIFMDQGKKSDALRMIDDGRIKSTTQATAIVLKREDPLIHTQIIGIGRVWIYKTFLYCK